MVDGVASILLAIHSMFSVDAVVVAFASAHITQVVTVTMENRTVTQGLQLTVGTLCFNAADQVADHVIVLEDDPGRPRVVIRPRQLIQAITLTVSSCVNRFRAIANEIFLQQPATALTPWNQATDETNWRQLRTLLDFIATLLVQCIPISINVDARQMRWSQWSLLLPVIPITTMFAPWNQATDRKSLAPSTTLLDFLKIQLKCIPVSIDADAQQMRWSQWSCLLPVIPTQ